MTELYSPSLGWTLLTALMLNACASPAAPNRGTTTEPTPEIASETGPAQTTLRSSNEDPSDLPEPFRSLGSRCDPSARANPNESPTTIVCSDTGNVVGVYQPADYLPQPPDAAVRLTPSPVRFGNEPYVALLGKTIWVRFVTCAGCVRVMGWSFVGDVSQLSDPQRLELQRRLGLDSSVAPLRTAGAWRAQVLPSLTPRR